LPGGQIQLFFDAATPQEIVGRMSGALAKIMRTEETKARFDSMGAFPVGGTPEGFDAFIAAETDK
jgi:tripartite-type tricarboxylate transporter receptor subunit TctC